jgi:uncharacterized protein (DUF2147 family)
MQTARFCTLFVVFTLLSASQHLFAQTVVKAGDILGIFFDRDHGCTIQVYKSDEQYFAKIITLTHANGKAQVGTMLLKNLVYDAGAWKGQIYAPKRNRDFPVTVTLPDPTVMQLKVNTPIGSRKLEWQRKRQ